MHLAPAKQLPRAIKLPNESTTDEGTIRDIFYLTARGTTTLYDKFDKPLDQFPELQNKFYTIRHKWCRGHTSGLRRDYISSISESLNGATRRETARKTQINPVKSLLKHSVRPYHQCYIEALSLGCNQYVSIVKHYYDYDIEVAKAFNIQSHTIAPPQYSIVKKRSSQLFLIITITYAHVNKS